MKKIFLLFCVFPLLTNSISSMQQKGGENPKAQPENKKHKYKEYKRKKFQEGQTTCVNNPGRKTEIQNWTIDGKFYAIDDRGVSQLRVDDSKHETGVGKRFNSCFFLSVGVRHIEVKKRIIEELERLSKKKFPEDVLAKSNMFASLVGDFLTTLYDSKYRDKFNANSFKLFEETNKNIPYIDEFLNADSNTDTIFTIYERAVEELAVNYVNNKGTSLIERYVDLFFGNDITVPVGSNGNVENAGALPLPNMIDVVADLFDLAIVVYGQAYLHTKRNKKDTPPDVDPYIWEDVTNAVWNSAGEVNKNKDNIRMISYDGRGHYRALVPMP